MTRPAAPVGCSSSAICGCWKPTALWKTAVTNFRQASLPCACADRRLTPLPSPWRAEEDIPTIITNDEAARNDYNLSPSRYVSTNGKEEVLPLEEAVVRLQAAEEERAKADRALYEVLQSLGLEVS